MLHLVFLSLREFLVGMNMLGHFMSVPLSGTVSGLKLAVPLQVCSIKYGNMPNLITKLHAIRRVKHRRDCLLRQKLAPPSLPIVLQSSGL